MRANCETLIQKLQSAPRVSAAASSCLTPDAAARFGFGDEVKIGKTKVFYRPLQSRVIEVARERVVLEKVLLFNRTGRGAIARGARRALLAARQQLAAAMAEKNLASLEAAMEAARAARVTFVLGARLEFTLHVPNMAALLALHADLVEEARCNDALGALLQVETVHLLLVIRRFYLPLATAAGGGPRGCLPQDRARDCHRQAAARRAGSAGRGPRPSGVLVRPQGGRGGARP